MAIPKRAWRPAIIADGAGYRDSAEIADLVNLERWPAGTRMIVRREKPDPPGAQSTFTDIEGWRFQAFITNQTDLDVAFFEAL